ncbi:MAG TPA: tyrosine-type recombinase/integrase [Stellaceae bacterium]|jgi:integrase|nr:tyrosine-type recombinase/integrase [Stellaceae bacterium]
MKIGHVRERSKNRWELRWRDVARKLQTITVSARSERDACAQLAALAGSAASNAPHRLTVGEWLKSWCDALDAAPVTRQNYKSVIDNWLIPELGDVRLKELTPIIVKTAFVRMAARGRKPSTLGQVRNVLSSALREAERLDMIARSPLDKLRGALPIGSSPAAQPANKKAVDLALAEAPVGNPYRIGLLLALACGMRRGEICGLRWSDVEAGKITVSRQIVPLIGGAITKAPKYDSTREIKIGPKLAEALRQHRRALAEQLLAIGVRISADHHVCTRADGSPLHPPSFSEWLKRRGIGLHKVRHLNASILIATQPLPIVSARLGHSRPDVTLRTYSHVLPGQDDAAADAIDTALG